MTVTVSVPMGHALHSMPSLTEPAWKLPLADATSPDLIRLVTEEWNQFRSTCMAIDQFNVDAESFQGKDAARPDDIRAPRKNARSTPMQKKHCRHGHGAERTATVSTALEPCRMWPSEDC